MINELVKVEDGNIVLAEQKVKQIIEFEQLKKEMEYQEKLLKEGLLEAMKKLGKDNFSVDGLSATLKKASQRTTIDTERLKKECPDIYEEYSRTSSVKASVTIRV